MIAAAAHSLTCFGGETLDENLNFLSYVELTRSSEVYIVCSVLR